MKKIIFHINQLCERGTTTATREMAIYSQKLIPNTQSFIMYRTDGEFKNNDEVRNQLTNDGIELLPYSIRDNSFRNIISFINPDLFYRLYSGDSQTRANSGVKEFNHAVFPIEDKGTDAYISSWLSDHMKTKGIDKPFLNHIVFPPKPHINAREGMRNWLNIPQDAFVFGRIGGYDSFDISFVRGIIDNITEKRDKVFFILINTQPFPCDRKRVLFLDKIIDNQTKSNVISACDAMIHARARGETFGISCAEFLSQGKPVLTWDGSRERAHIDVINSSGRGEDMLYNSENLLEKMENMIDNPFTVDVQQALDEFSPNKVIEKFVELTKIV